MWHPFFSNQNCLTQTKFESSTSPFHIHKSFGAMFKHMFLEKVDAKYNVASKFSSKLQKRKRLFYSQACASLAIRATSNPNIHMSPIFDKRSSYNANKGLTVPFKMRSTNQISILTEFIFITDSLIASITSGRILNPIFIIEPFHLTRVFLKTVQNFWKIFDFLWFLSIIEQRTKQ